MFSINGYTFLHLGRINKSEGGVRLYIIATFDSIIRVNLYFTDENLECLFAEIVQINKCNVLIGCFYRPPNADVISFNSKIVDILDKLDKEIHKTVLILGDFNLDLLKHRTHNTTSQFLNCMLSHSFFPCIMNPTRITSTSATLLDNIFINYF